MRLYILYYLPYFLEFGYIWVQKVVQDFYHQPYPDPFSQNDLGLDFLPQVRAAKDHTNVRILQNSISGIPFLLGFSTIMQDPCVYAAFWAPMNALYGSSKARTRILLGSLRPLCRASTARVFIVSFYVDYMH